jgi:hypothetical protein
LFSGSLRAVFYCKFSVVITQRGQHFEMRSAICRIASISLLLGLTSVAFAQEGHPMVGSWVGDWGPNTQERHRVVMVLEWTGGNLVGTINPGPNAIPIKRATVNPTDWSLHVEADGMDAQGRPAPYVIDGKIDDIGTYNRTLAGTWRVGGVQGNFSVTRQ